MDRTAIPRLRCRSEDFGGVVYLPDVNTRVAVNADLFAILSALQGAPTVTDAARRVARALTTPLTLARRLVHDALRQLQRSIDGAAPSREALTPAALSLRAPLLLIVEVTARCNRACTFCYQEGDAPLAPTLTPDELIRLIDAAAAAEVLKVQFMGGEPTLFRAFPRLVERACRQGLFVSFTTNGTPPSAELMDTLQTPDVRAQLLPIQVSIHAASHAQAQDFGGSLAQYKAATKTCERLAAAGLRFGVKTIISRRSVATAYLSIAQAAALGATSITLLHLLPVGGGQRMRADIGMTASDLRILAVAVDAARARYPDLHVDYRPFLSVYFPRMADTACEALVDCPAGTLDVRVRYDGRVIQCSSLRTAVLGDVRSESLADIWRAFPSRRHPCPYPVGSLLPPSGVHL